jgi:hypothetical protein
MSRVANDDSRLGQFDDFTEVHHHYPVAHMLYYRQIMRDKQVGDSSLLLQILKETDNLRLDGHVECADRFVTNDEFRLDRQRPGDANPLALAAAEFVRVAASMAWVQPHCRQQARHPGFPPGSAPGKPMNIECLADDVFDRHPRIERVVRILKHHLDPPSTSPQVGPVQVANIIVIEKDGAGRWFDQSHNGTAQGRLAAAAFSH